MAHVKNNNQVRREAGREKVIKAAFELFATKGYAQTSVDSIALKARISKGLIYYYFKSKPDILKGIFSNFMTDFEKIFEGKETLSPKQFLKQLSDYSFDFITNQKKFSRLMMALMAQPDVVKGLKKEMDHIREKWFFEIGKSFKALGYKKDAEAEVYLFCAILDGISLQYISVPDYPIKNIQSLIEKKYGLTPG